MSSTGHGLSKKGMLRLVILFAAALLAIILIRGFTDRKPDLSTLPGRQAYLHELGWEIDPSSEAHKTVRIPDSLNDVMTKYNDLQLKQGCDLNGHLGEKCEQFSYSVLNYPDADQTVQITLYVQGKTMIAGDIHSTALNGFMKSLTEK